MLNTQLILSVTNISPFRISVQSHTKQSLLLLESVRRALYTVHDPRASMLFTRTCVHEAHLQDF